MKTKFCRYTCNYCGTVHDVQSELYDPINPIYQWVTIRLCLENDLYQSKFHFCNKKCSVAWLLGFDSKEEEK